MTVFSWAAVESVIDVQVSICLGYTLARTDLDFMPGISGQITWNIWLKAQDLRCNFCSLVGTDARVGYDRSLPWRLTPASCLDIGIAAVARRRGQAGALSLRFHRALTIMRGINQLE